MSSDEDGAECFDYEDDGFEDHSMDSECGLLLSSTTPRIDRLWYRLECVGCADETFG